MRSITMAPRKKYKPPEGWLDFELCTSSEADGEATALS